MVYPLLDGRSLQQKIEEAKSLLQENGYLVKDPVAAVGEVKTPAQLVRFFYDTLARYNPDFKFVFSGNPRDRVTAKRFIESRISLGAGRERALSECCEIIKLLFKYEGYLGLTFKITSMGVLGQDRMGWVTERVLEINEGLNRQINKDEDEKWWQSLYDQQEAQVAPDALEEARSKMDRMLYRYGKEKSKEV